MKIKILIAPLMALALAAPALADHMTGLPPSARHQELPIELKQVAPDLYFYYNDSSSNSAFLVASEGVLVVDSGQHPADARDLLARIRSVTDKPIRFVINTHFHGDHVFGNPVFHALGATIIAHRDPAELRMDLPDLALDGNMSITLGGRTINLLHLGAGQNPGDLLVHFSHARTVFVGGPFARRNWSNTSFTPSVDNWIAVL